MDIYWTSEGSGPAIVLVHGWTCNTTAWQEQMADLKDSYRVIALDLPGHGLSGAPEGGALTMNIYASAVEAVRVDAGLESIVLVGHSMGVPVISRYAIDYPEHVAGLIGVDGSFVPLPVFRPEPPQGSIRAFREQAIRGMFVPGTSPEVQDSVLHMMLGPSDEQATAAGQSLLTFSIDEGQRIEQPALLVLAGNAAEPDAERLGQTLPSLRITALEGTGHFLMMEEPDAFNRLLRQFFGEIDFE
jgi:pimeloyl-ACP methyl ester carboxylesterase